MPAPVSVPSVSAALARIASIQTRFAPQGFAGALQRAQAGAGGVPAQGVPGAGPSLSPPPVAGVPAPAPAVVAGTHARRPVLATAVQGAQPAGAQGQGWVQRLPERGQRWAPAITVAAQAAGLDPALLGALVWAESSFDPGAVSPAGARGLAQLMPGTARELGVDIADPQANLAGGARYLRAQLDRFGALDLALAAYNAGPGAVARAGGVPAFAETRAYVPRVLDYYARLQGAP